MKHVYKVFTLVVISILLFYANPIPSYAEFPFFTEEISDYLLVGNGPVSVADAVNTNNHEFGANKAPVPSNFDCNLTLEGAVPPIAPDTLPVFSGISDDGNIAIIDPQGVYNLQNVGVFADMGIKAAAPTLAGADDGTSNSFFNDPQFPNTFDGIDDCTFFAGDPPKLIDDPNFAGVMANVDFTALIAELYGVGGAQAIIPGLVQTDTLDVSSGIPGSASQGVIQSTTVTINLNPGQNVIDVVTGGGVDFLLQESTLIIDGPASAFAIIRIPDDANFIISNGNVLVGDGGIGLNNVVFYSDRPDNNEHFNFDNTILNGVAFWSLDEEGGEININNAQGCTQLIADKITLNNVRFTRCAPDGDRMVGGTGISIDKTALLVYSVETNASWMIPAIVSAIGIGIVLARKF